MEKILQNIYENFVREEGNIISVLQELQERFGYVPPEAVDWLSRRLNIPASRFFGIVTFYAQFHLTPRGKNIITACCGTACHVKGSERLLTGIQKELGLEDGRNTTSDGEFTLEKVNCVGACSIAPVIIINKKIHGKVSPESLAGEFRQLKGKESE